MELASDEQREILRANMGRKDEACVEKVRRVYEELNVGKICVEHQKKEFEELKAEFDNFGVVAIPKGLVGYLLSLLDNRKI